MLFRTSATKALRRTQLFSAFGEPSREESVVVSGKCDKRIQEKATVVSVSGEPSRDESAVVSDKCVKLTTVYENEESTKVLKEHRKANDTDDELSAITLKLKDMEDNQKNKASEKKKAVRRNKQKIGRRERDGDTEREFGTGRREGLLVRKRTGVRRGEEARHREADGRSR